MNNEEKMSIEQYKDALVGIINEMEKEHGCEVRSVHIEHDVTYCGPYKTVNYNVEIEL